MTQQHHRRIRRTVHGVMHGNTVCLDLHNPLLFLKQLFEPFPGGVTAGAFLRVTLTFTR